MPRAGEPVLGKEHELRAEDDCRRRKDDPVRKQVPVDVDRREHDEDATREGIDQTAGAEACLGDRGDREERGEKGRRRCRQGRKVPVFEAVATLLSGRHASSVRSGGRPGHCSQGWAAHPRRWVRRRPRPVCAHLCRRIVSPAGRAVADAFVGGAGIVNVPGRVNGPAFE